MKLSIKVVDGLDIGHIRKMSRDFVHEMESQGKHDYPGFDEEELDKQMLHILTNLHNTNYIFLIAYDGKKPAGFFLGYIAEHEYGKPRRVGVAQELYVVPSKRGKNLVAFKLIQKAVEIALTKDIQGFECVGSYNTTDKRWEELGFKLHLTYGHMPIDQMLQFVGRRKHE